MNYPAGPRGFQPQRVAIVIVTYNAGRVVAAVVRACRAIPSVDLLIVIDDGSTDDTSHVARTAGIVVTRHFVECGCVPVIEAGTKVTAMRGRPDRPPRHILSLSPDLDDSAVEVTALVEAVFARQADMAIAALATDREYSGYGPDIARRLIRRKIGQNCHYPLSYQHCLTYEMVDAVMPFSDRYVLEASVTINVLRTGLPVVGVPCSLTHSGADRSLGSLNRPARMSDTVHVTANQLLHSDVRSKRRADYGQGIGAPYPAPVSARDEVETSDPPDARRTKMVG